MKNLFLIFVFLFFGISLFGLEFHNPSEKAPEKGQLFMSIEMFPAVGTATRERIFISHYNEKNYLQKINEYGWYEITLNDMEWIFSQNLRVLYIP